MVIGEVAVVNQRFVQAGERVRPPGMPHSASGGVPLMGDPDVSVEVVQLIVFDGLLGIAHDLDYHHVSALGEHKRQLVTFGLVKPPVETHRIPADKLVFRVTVGHGLQAVLSLELFRAQRV